jgi:hypothetical protein
MAKIEKVEDVQSIAKEGLPEDVVPASVPEVQPEHAGAQFPKGEGGQYIAIGGGKVIRVPASD